MTKFLKKLNEKLEESTSTTSYHNDSFHYYKGRTDALNEVLRLLKSEAEESEKGEQKKHDNKRSKSN